MKTKKSSKQKSPKKSKEIPQKEFKNPPVIDSFSLLNSSIQEILKQLGYESLTKVQNKMISEILNRKNKNIICKSTKGSGKMLSFLLPIIHKILENEKNEKIERFIIITGIKERAQDLYSMSKELMNDIDGKKVAVCIGGANRKKEYVKLIDKNVKLIISMPQRIVEYIKNDKGDKLILKKDISTIIFDKVENMEKNGYIRELKEIIEIFGFDIVKISKKQIKKVVNENINFIFYCQYEEYENDDGEDEDNNKIQSDIRELIESSERNYNTIIIKENIKKNENSKNKISKPIISKRGYIILDPSKKFLFLLTFLRKNPNKKIIVFFATTKEIIFYNSLLNLYHIQTDTIFSDSTRSLKTNQTILNDFSKKKNGILLCTDLSKMRLNLPPCDWAIFYDSPSDVTTFEKNLEIKNWDDYSMVNEIKSFMILMPNEIDLLKEKKEYDIVEFNLSISQIDRDQQKVEKMVNTKEHSVLVLAFEAYREFLFDYASRNNKHVFDVDNIDVTKLCKSFGFEFPPFVNLSPVLNLDNYNETKSKKKSYLFPDEIQKIYGTNS
jgi:ATP-dependent RNA helicase DDX18/HAS1